ALPADLREGNQIFSMTFLLFPPSLPLPIALDILLQCSEADEAPADNRARKEHHGDDTYQIPPCNFLRRMSGSAAVVHLSSTASHGIAHVFRYVQLSGSA